MPLQPTLTLTAASSTSFTATISGADSGATVTIYYRQVGALIDTTGPTIAGPSGSATVSNLTANAGYIAYAVSNLAGSNSLPSLAVVSLATTDSLPGAMVAALKANAGFMSLCPQVWLEEVPSYLLNAGGGQSRIELPWAIVEGVEENNVFTFEKAYYVEATAKVSCYATTADAAEKIRIAADAAIDWQALPFLTSTTISVDPESVRTSGEWALARDSSKVFEKSIQFKVRMTRSL